MHNIYSQTQTPNESPKFVTERLADFDRILAKVPSKKKTEYLTALEKCPNECSDDFKLVFLRCEVFNVEPAVNRWCNYWKARVEVFREKAYRSLRANRMEDKDVQDCSYTQVASKDDVEGRAIFLIDYQQEELEMSDDTLVRSVWYSVHQALQKESAQQRGIVVFARCGTNLVVSMKRSSVTKKCISNFRGVLPVRLAGCHVVNPPTFLGVMLKVLKQVIGSKMGKRIYVHSGTTDEVLHSLSRFQLGTKEMLPALFGGFLEFA